MRKTTVVINLVLILLCVAMLAFLGCMTAKAIDLYTPDKPKYADTTEGCVYYMLDDIPQCFEYYLGYEPKMEFNPKAGKIEAEAKIYLTGNRYLTVPVKLYAPNMWGLEVPSSADDNLFKQWGCFSLNCFSRTVELEFINERGLGIYFDMPTAQKYFCELTRSNEELSFNKYTISMNGKTYDMLHGNDVKYIVTDDTIISARTLSQVIYDWEMAHPSKEKPMYLGNIFGFGI